MSGIMYGKDRNKKYELGQKIKSGGEGTVYSIVGQSKLVAKVYKAERLADSSLMKPTEEKILAMLDMNFNPQTDGKLIVAWPTDALYDSSGNFIGYIMPKIENMKSIIWAMRPSDRDAFWLNGYRWQYSIAIAFNLAYVIEKLHAAGIVVGDMNTNNILIDPTGNVTLIDAGSFNISTKQGRLYKCIVGFPEVLPPELQGKDLTKPNNQFSDKTDCFALAIHVFTLLNNNCHPFGCLDYNTEHASSSNPKIMDNILKGFCPYVNGETGNTVEDSLGMAVFSKEINTLFQRAFQYNANTAVKQTTIANRPTAKEWREALEKFYQAGFSSCNKNPLHEFSKNYNGGCPWCAIEFRKSNNTGAGTNQGTGVGTNAGTRTGSGRRTGKRTGNLPVPHKLIPVIHCDQNGNVLCASQIDVEYGKSGYAYAINIQGYHLISNKTKIKIKVNRKGKENLSEVRFNYKKDREKKSIKDKFFNFICVIAVLYCLIMYGLIKTSIHNCEYEKALVYMNLFPGYFQLFSDEYNSVRNEVMKIENQRDGQIRRNNYDSAVRYYQSGDYTKAYNLFDNISSSYLNTALYTTFCKAHIYTASDYFSTIYDNINFADAKDLLTMNSDMFAEYMKGSWHYNKNGGGTVTVTMDSEHYIHNMPEGLGSNYNWSVKNGKYRYNLKDSNDYTDYFTIKIHSSTMFVLHSIQNNTDYRLYKDD